MEPIGEFARAAELAAEGEEVIVFIDELTTLPPAAQGAALRFLDSGLVGGVRIPPDVWRVAAANPPELAAGGFDLEAPTANRVVHLEWQLDPLGWADQFAVYWGSPPKRLGDLDLVAWGRARALVAAFIRVAPNLLLRVPDNPVERGRAWPSPRTWDLASRVLAAFDCNVVEAAGAIVGAVGQAAGLQFVEWAKRQSLPTVEELLTRPEVIEQLSGDARYAALSAVAASAPLVLDKEGQGEFWARAWELARVAASICRDVAAGTLVHVLAEYVRKKGYKPPRAALQPYVELVLQAGES